MKMQLLIITVIGMINLSTAYAVSPENAKIMAEKYRALAESYNKLAQEYEMVVKNEDMLNKTPALTIKQKATDDAKKIQTKELKVQQQNKDIQSQANDSTPLNPWSIELETQKEINNVTKSPVHTVSENQSKRLIGLSELILPEGIMDDNIEVQKIPNITVLVPWKGTSFGLGGSIVTGNSAATNYNANANISYNPIIPWENTLVMSYLYNRDDMSGGKGVKTNKFQALGTTSWNFDKNNGLYASLNYLNDQLDTYTYLLTESFGYKRQLYSRHNMSLNTTLGPSLTQSKIKESGEFANALGAQNTINYVWNFTDASSFKQNFLVNWTASDATTYQTNSTLSTELYENLILQLGFQVNGSSWASSGKKRINTVTSTTIAYTF